MPGESRINGSFFEDQQEKKSMNQAPYEMSEQAATALTREAHSQAHEDPVERPPSHEPQNPNVTPSEAVYAFAAWLTTRADSLTVGAQYECSDIAALVADFCEVQGFEPPRDAYPRNMKTMQRSTRERAKNALQLGREKMLGSPRSTRSKGY